jgi:hypothetical protein
MSSLESIIDSSEFSKWLGLKMESSKHCLEKQLSTWHSDPKRLQSISARFKRFKDAISLNPQFYDKCINIIEDLSTYEKTINKLLNKTSELEKESYGELIFFKPFLQSLNFIPFILSAWSFIRIYLFPGMSFLVPFLTLVAPYFLMRFAFELPITFNNYIHILHSLASGQFNNLVNPGSVADTKSLGINPLQFIKQFGIIIFTFIQGIVQPYWSYKHLKSIDNIVCEKGTIIQKFEESYQKLYNLLKENGFTFFKCPLPKTNHTHVATARAILDSSYYKLALKYIGSLEIILRLAKHDNITRVKWINNSSTPVFKLINTYDFNVPSKICKPVSIQFETEIHHALLTGPNKGGKSTVLRALSISSLLAHTYGCAISDYCEMTPFKKMYVCLKPDDLPGSKSRFEREIEFTSNTLKENNNTLVFIDELFHSTNPPDALRSCEIYCDKLWNKSNTISVISTHLFDLVRKSPKNIKRICCPAKITESGSIDFTYKLCEGICEVSSVDELLRKNGLIT